ncbi:ISKra4 family transposase [Micromonospora sp. WMMA1363]|uniref:ISKra4 family transposase n=1 Tax=Micromonospora sp. WMMA1363 TaxID=3053985 RepID=UPI00259C9149|nr:ISKra4 family transposase [Micromonospora sp. WMMA1363]MDM4723430.1 ISKra4 family transposase [Micromonospora sp. WMMA1363]
MTHAELEERLHTDGMRLLCQLLQDSLDLRASREERLDEVTDADSHLRGWAERGRQRTLATRFGEVVVTRIAYRARARADLNPADAVLNLPVEKHSHGLRRLAAAEAARGSFTDAAAAIERATTVRIGKRQVEALAAAAAIDVDAFYTAHAPDWSADDDVLALSFDAKGVVMRPDGLRAGTAKAAVSQKLAGRRSKGEKRNRKRMCEVAAVFDVTGKPRTIADILPEDPEAAQTATPAPVTSGKWLHASVTDDAAAVIAAGFAEADRRRDPDHARTWIALVDGNTHQIDRIHAEAKTRKITLPVVVDFIHVIEYLWKATWCFHPEGRPERRTVGPRPGPAGVGRTGRHSRRSHPTQGHLPRPGPRQTQTRRCRRRLPAGQKTVPGLPDRAGQRVADRHRGDRRRLPPPGQRSYGRHRRSLGLDGAEAILKLRTLISNGDFDQYWTWHLAQEQQRIHNSRYLGGAIPQ